MGKYYIGLGNTFHDSALAILDAQGEVLFAEATERRLQSKRALNCIPDNFGIEKLLAQYCSDATSFVVAGAWSKSFFQALEQQAAAGEFSLAHLQSPALRADLSYLFPRSSILEMGAYQYHYLLNTGMGMLMAIEQVLGPVRVTFRDYPHHRCHAAFAAYGSPFQEAACLVVDGHGEGGSYGMYQYAQGKIEELYLHQGPESLGMLYEMVTLLCGFDWFKGEEWKVMGLAPYGREEQEMYALIRSLCTVEGERLRYVPHDQLVATLAALRKYQRPADANPWEAADLALAGQRVFEEVMGKLLGHLHQRTGSDRLVLGGGCALNSSFNGRITEKTPFRELYVPSAPADDGNAIGAALLAFQEDHPTADPLGGRFLSPYLGSSISDVAVKRLEQFGGVRSVRKLSFGLYQEVARCIAEGKLIGWVQGRAEFGPRALGNRSILADPRPATMKDTINARVKFREEFRPFAPSILHEHGPAYFMDYVEAPYMERTLYFHPEVRDQVPAVVHANQTGRLHSVRKEHNPRYHALISAFYALTGIPLLLNTSLNVMGKPIVHSAEDAIALFMTTGLDVLVINDYVIEK